jgi:hypothetical protein
MSPRAVFIVSSGRSGTAMMEKLFRALPGVEMHHEYMVHITQKLGCRYAMGLAGDDEAAAILRETHLAAAAHSAAPVWGDSSNKLSWLIRPLARLMPEARFVHLTRDGRKVAGSYLRKLGEECYDDGSTAALAGWLAAPDGIPPPPEKRYWWPHPTADDPDAARWPGFDQFERIAWHWNAINREIALACSDLPAGRTLRVRLEDLVADRAVFERFIRFCWCDPTEDAFAMLGRPHNVNRPEDAPLTPAQDRAFWRIAAEQMNALGYAGEPEYAMRY